MKKHNQIIIVGGGSSISHFPSTVWQTLSSKFTIGCNSCFNDFTPTTLCCADGEFYKGIVDFDIQTHLWNKFDPSHREKLSKLPLIIALNTPQAVENPLLNTVFVKSHPHTWFRHESLSKGFLCHSLTGQLALSIASYLLNFEGDVFLLGFDSNKSGNTHYYKHTEHRGIGFLDYYRGNDLNKLFLPYTTEKSLNIYHVLMSIEIDIFEKLTPETFLKKIEGNDYNQNELRADIQKVLNEK